MLRVDDITVRYGEQNVLRDISFELQPGETLVLLGANGAGKTTLIRAVNGTLPITKGGIFLEGHDMRALSRREIAKEIAAAAQENETRLPDTVFEFVL